MLMCRSVRLLLRYVSINLTPPHSSPSPRGRISTRTSTSASGAADGRDGGPVDGPG